MLLKTSLPRIKKAYPAKSEVRPGFAAADLSFEYGRDSQTVEIPFTFQLFKRLQAHNSNLIPGCLNPMTRGLLINTGSVWMESLSDLIKESPSKQVMVKNTFLGTVMRLKVSNY